NEVGIFEMTSTGLAPVANPSQMFLAERPADAAGSVVTACMEGTRPMLVEIQALVSSSKYRTVSTMCSKARGPAIDPSLVTWPMRKIGTPRVFASIKNCAATSRICEIEPGADSISHEKVV